MDHRHFPPSRALTSTTSFLHVSFLQASSAMMTCPDLKEKRTLPSSISSLLSYWSFVHAVSVDLRRSRLFHPCSSSKTPLREQGGEGGGGGGDEEARQSSGVPW